MDCFYAAVEVKHRPELRGKPLGIGGPPQSRSVLCTASYEARKFKVRAAMPSSQAVRLCPDLILIPPRFELYRKESRAVRQILERFTSVIEPLSLDEAYLDVTDSPLFNGSATLIAAEIRRQIKEECQLTASAGIAPNKFLAKVASDWNKPDGQFVIAPHQVSDFVAKLKVEKIFGVGKVTAQKMHDNQIFTCADLQIRSLHELARLFGSRGPDYYDLARGVDNRSVKTDSERKSLTVEETFNRDRETLKDCLAEVAPLYEEFEKRMLKNPAYRELIRGYVIKLKFSDFKSTTHEVSFREWPKLEDFKKLLETAWERRGEPVRLIGLGVRLATTKKESSDEDSPQLSFAV